MRVEDDPHLREVLMEAADLPPERRGDYLDIACAGDVERIRELQSLLFQLDGDVTGSAATQRPAPPSHPDRIGRYRIIEAVGEGGMGTVYRAEQEHPVRRTVALKLIKVGMDTRQVVARFNAERQALAMMDHPHIAHVYDAGATDTGRPYFVMELVEGVLITDYCDSRRMPVRERLELFALVCQAMQHAHTKGVIHRDLKPSNILVATAEGKPAPKVIDFGIAKATQGRLTDQTLTTEVGSWIGTPQYMSPEQADGGRGVDTRSDVYSLGVILYELLTGHNPHDLGGSRTEVLRRISETEPIRPRSVSKAIDGDVEALLLKALARSPDDRYASAGELSRDVINYLAGEPLVARRPTVGYLLRKKLWQHRAKVSVAATMLCLVGGVGAFGIVGVRRARLDALANAHVAQVQWANGLVLQADAYTEGRHWLDAAGLYRSGFEELVRLGAPTVDTDLGLWDLNRLAAPPIAVWPEQAAKVLAVAFTPDGNRVLSSSTGKVLEVREARTARLLQRIALPTTATSICVLPDGRRAMFAGTDGSVRLWDVPSETEIKVFASTGYYAALNTSLDGLRVACGRQDGLITVWDVESGREVRMFSGLTEVAMDVAFSHDGRQLVSAGSDGAVYLWDVESGKRIRMLGDAKQSVFSICWSADDRLVAWGGQDQTWLLDLTGQPPALPRPLGRHGANVTGVSFSSDGRRLLACGADSTLKVWDTDAGTLAAAFSGHGQQIAGATFSPDGRVIASAGWDGRVRIWQVEGGPEVLTLPTGKPVEVTSVAFSPDGRLLASSGQRGWIFVRDVATGKQVIKLFGQDPSDAGSGMAFGTCFNPAGDRIVTGGWADRCVRVWNFRADGNYVLGYHDDRVFSVAVSPDWQWIASGDEGGVIKIWRMGQFNQCTALHRCGHAVRRLAFLPNGRSLLASRDDGVLDMLDARTGRPVWQAAKAAVQDGPELSVLRDEIAAYVSPDGSMIASASMDNSLRLWDPVRGSQLFNLGGHDSGVFDLAYFPDRSRILSIGGDRLAKLWDVRARRRLRTFGDLSHVPVCVAVAPGGARAAIGCSDGTVLLWDFSAVGRCRDLESAAEAARATIQTKPDDPAAWMALGEWYAARNADGWAVDCLTRARRLGAAVDPTRLARCYWRLDRFPDARREFETAIQKTKDPATRDYLQLCMEAVIRSEAESAPRH